MQSYFIAQGQDRAPLEVQYEGTPPCLWCGEPVRDPSMDGPLVCGLCDMGCVLDNGVCRKWTAAEHQARREHFRKKIEEISAQSQGLEYKH